MLRQIINSQKNVSFSDMVKLLEAFGFTLSRVNGSHHIFAHPVASEVINIQNQKGKAKPYQIRQFLILVEANNLTIED